MASSETKRKILVAMDGSKQSECALKYFKEQVHQDGDDVIVVYAAEHGNLASQPVFSTDPKLVAHLASEEEKEVQNKVQSLKRIMTNVGVQGRVERYSANTPGEAVIKAASDHNVDLIVTGTRGLGKLRRTLMGSVSQYIVHHAHVPVLVCREK